MCVIESKLPGQFFRHKLLFQFSGSGTIETGSGPGVEREVYNVLSRCLVYDSSTIDSNSASSSGSNRMVTAQSIRSNTSNNNIDENIRKINNKYAIFHPVGDSNTGSSDTLGVYEPLHHDADNNTAVRNSGGSTSIMSKTVTTKNSSMSSSNSSDIHIQACYEIFGRLLGHLLLRSVASTHTSTHNQARFLDFQASSMLCLQLTDPFWKLIFNEVITLEDLANTDVVLYTNLTWLLEHSDVHELDLYFTTTTATSSMHSNKTTSTSNTTEKVIIMIENGDNILVTDTNKQLYIQKILEYKVINRLSTSAKCVRKGILAVIPEEVFNLFNFREISMMLTGIHIYMCIIRYGIV